MKRLHTSPLGHASVAVAAALLFTGCAGESEPGSTEAVTSPPPDPTGWSDADAFEEVVFEGTADESLELPEDVQAAEVVVFDVVYEEGAEALMLFTTDADGDFVAVLVDTFLPITGDDQGAFSGQTLSVRREEDPATHLRVEADSSWRITARPPSELPELPESGSGHGVFLYSGPGGEVGVHGTGAEGGLAIEQVDPAMTGPSQVALLEFEERSGTGSLAAGPSLVHVKHNGPWSLDLP